MLRGAIGNKPKAKIPTAQSVARPALEPAQTISEATPPRASRELRPSEGMEHKLPLVPDEVKSVGRQLGKLVKQWWKRLRPPQ